MQASSVVSAIRLSLSHVQNLGLVGGLHISFPSSVLEFFAYIQVVNLSFTEVLRLLELPVITQRLAFVGISIIAPLAVVVLSCLVFFPVSALQLIALTVAGWGILALHTVAFAAPEMLSSALTNSVDTPASMIVAFAAALAPLLWQPLARIGAADISHALLDLACSVAGLTLSNADQVAVYVLVSCNFFVSAYDVITSFGRGYRKVLQLLVLLPLHVVGGYFAAEAQITRFPGPIGYTSYILVGLAVLSALRRFTTALGLSACSGNGILRVQGALTRLLDAGLLTFSLFCLSFMFTPAMTQALSVLTCVDYTCPDGTIFNPLAERPSTDPYTTDSAVFCTSCNFGSCRYSDSDLCPAQTLSRLLSDPQVSCEDGLYGYYAAATGLVLGVFALCIPCMMWRVTRACTEELLSLSRETVRASQSIYVKLDHCIPAGARLLDPVTLDESWRNLVDSVTPKAASLYNANTYAARYFSLFEMVQKVILIFAAVLLSPWSPVASAWLTLAAHAAMLIAVLATEPFLSRAEWKYSCVLYMCSSVTSMYAVMLVHWPRQLGASWLGIAMVIFNIFVPVVVGIILLVHQFKDTISRWCGCAAAADLSLKDNSPAARRRRLVKAVRRQINITVPSMRATGVYSICVNPSDELEYFIVRPNEGPARAATSCAVSPLQIPPQPSVVTPTGGLSDFDSPLLPKKPQGLWFEDDLELTSLPSPIPGRSSQHAQQMPLPASVVGPTAQPASAAASPVSPMKHPSPKTKPVELRREAEAVQRLDIATKQTMVRFFFFLAAPLLLAALAVTVVVHTDVFTTGSLDLSGAALSDTEFIFASSPYDRTAATVLGGYPSWDEFAARCCCAFTADAASNTTTERWVCTHAVNATDANWTRGAVVDRRRSVDYSTGLPLRPVCAAAVAPECAVTVQADNALMSCAADYVNEHSISEYALTVLW